jgi:glycosyltransferase involved in cell wall biosynthesis
MKKKHNQIAWVIPPITLSMSALAKYKKPNPHHEWLFQYEDQIIFSSFSRRWIELSNVYMRSEGFLWLFFKLPYRLISGKYSLFIVHARDPQGVIVFIISKLLRKEIVISDTFFIWSESIRARLFWPLSKYISSHATILAVPSVRVKSFWEATGISSGKIRISNPFVSVIKTSQKSLVEADRIKQKFGYKKTVLFTGRLIKEKGLEYLIRAFEGFSNSKDVGLLIVGDGPDRDRIETLTRKLKLTNVSFVWRANEREDITPYFMLCDVFVLPSITVRCHEEWGLVVNEVMSVGKPVVVSSSVGSAYSLVRDGVNGYIVPEQNSRAIFEAIKKLIDNDDLRLKMGKEAASTIINGFTYSHAIKHSRKLLQYALGFED